MQMSLITYDFSSTPKKYIWYEAFFFLRKELIYNTYLFGLSNLFVYF